MTSPSFGRRGQSQDAQRDMERAIAVSKSLVRRNPEVPSYRRSLAVHHANLGDLWHSAGRPAESEREYGEALRLAEALAAEQPGLLDYRALRALYRSSIAFLFHVTGRYHESESAYEKVVAELEALRREFPRLPHLRASLASAYNQRGAVLGLLKRPREAELSFDAGDRLAEGLAAEIPGVPSYRVRPPRPSPRSRKSPSIDGETGPARRLNERRSATWSPPRGRPREHSNRFLLLRTTSALAQLQAREGDGRAVDASARRIEELPRSPIEHYNAACFLSLVLRAVRGGNSPSRSGRHSPGPSPIARWPNSPRRSTRGTGTSAL